MLREKRLHASPWRWGAVLVAVLAFGTALAGSADNAAATGRVPKPVIEAGRGDKCVAATDFMRRNHMNLLLHRRDETVHQGIRTQAFSLNGCIECHASGKPASVVGSDRNFCQACHSYVAVKLDCFTCHASKPRAITASVAGRGGRVGAVP